MFLVMSVTRQREKTENATAPSTAVVNAIAEHKGIDPLELDRPLYDVINPDALDSLFSQSTNGGAVTGRLTFSYGKHTVHVTSDGDVQVTD